MVSEVLRRCVDALAEEICVCASSARWVGASLRTSSSRRRKQRQGGCSAQEGSGLCSTAWSPNHDLQRHLPEETKG
ncbi:hypothetical protein CesoFtcFv8_021217 [Champsocephalus esox]|uniref:Uncharacterized protein n=1 Tax=Champsocephalus esox TaxID=159716 RepID=A0AAN8BCH3_9TELE|nr:hypothetical protein CesoFtcFv8_021217 [Champsocephalus esox]